MKNSKIFKLFFHILYDALTNNGWNEQRMYGCGLDFWIYTDNNKDYFSFVFVGCRDHFKEVAGKHSQSEAKYKTFGDTEEIDTVEVWFTDRTKVVEVFGEHETHEMDFNTPIAEVYQLLNTVNIDWRCEIMRLTAGDVFISDKFEELCSIKGMKQAKIELKKLQDLLAD